MIHYFYDKNELLFTCRILNVTCSVSYSSEGIIVKADNIIFNYKNDYSYYYSPYTIFSVYLEKKYNIKTVRVESFVLMCEILKRNDVLNMVSFTYYTGLHIRSVDHEPLLVSMQKDIYFIESILSQGEMINNKILNYLNEKNTHIQKWQL